MKKCLHLLLFAVIVLAGCSSGNKEEQVQITVSAAASLSDVLEEITVDFEKKHPDINVQFNFGASGALKEQIEQGAPVDVFISASTEKFDELVAGDFAKEGMNLVRNELVLIAPVEQEDVQTFQDLSSDTVEKIALGTPDVVPAGQYGQQALAYYDVWNNIESKIVYAKDVRQVLTYVETNNAQAGIVYKTDALTSDKVRIVQTADAGSHDRIVYPAGIVSSTKLEKDAQLFLDYLVEENVQTIWEQHGFQME
jgi:molybdate transport system substrate-binding protein